MKIQIKENTTLLNFVLNYFPDVSVTKAKKMILYNCFSIAGASIKSFEYILHKGDTIDYQKYSGGRHIAREKRDATVLYEDMDVIIANKPAGVTVFNPKSKKKEDLFSEIRRYVVKSNKKAIVNILFAPMDNESGLCMFAKNKFAYNILSKEKEKLEFEINAIVSHPLKHKNDKIKYYYRYNKKKLELSRTVADGFQEFVFEYHTIADYSTSKENFYHICIRPKENIELVLRAILSHMGNPVVGEQIFDRQIRKNMLKFAYSSIRFQRTDNGRKTVVDCQLPKQFASFNTPVYYSEKTQEEEK
ncbi:MAG: hypothetical protein IJ180_10175 [Bacteroidales bacterium]|nr:hypothetical protein [Bacteroidales bacterium]